jgi:hypothetical protein
MSEQKLLELKEYLSKKFKPNDLTPLVEEDFDIYSAAGGNVDDAFSLGLSAGQADMIQEILTFLG